MRIYVFTVRGMTSASFDPFQIVLYQSAIRTTKINSCCLGEYRNTTASFGIITRCTVLWTVFSNTFADDDRRPFIRGFICQMLSSNTCRKLSCPVVYNDKPKYLWLLHSFCGSAATRWNLLKV